MDEKTIRGVLTYNEKEYPFVIEKRVLTIVQPAFRYRKDFQQEEYLGTLTGVTDKNKYILLLDCRILNYAFLSLSPQIQIGLHGYILQDTEEDYFDSIEFYSPALLAFYTPRKAWKPELTEENDLQGITLTPYEDVAKEIPVTIGDEELLCSLGFARYFNLGFEDQYAMSIRTGLILDLPTRRNSQDLGKYYLYIRDFLAFINFKRGIPFDEIILWRRGADGKRHKSGIAVIFQTESSDYKPDAFHSITYDDLGNNSFSALLKETAEQRLQGTYNPYYLPADRSEANTVEVSRWLMTAISFEGEYNKWYGNKKAERDAVFYETKETLLQAIDTVVQQSGLSLNNSKNKYYKSFRHLIDRFDTTIQEKFQFCEAHFNDEIKQVKERQCRLSKVPMGTNFAEKYAQMHNLTAHGDIEAIAPEDIVTFQMLRCFIYLLVMERAAVPSDKRKDIIRKLFLS